MFYPTRLAVILMAAGAPVGVALSLARPELWAVGLVWIGMAGLLMLLDALLCPSGRSVSVNIDAPPLLYVGRSGETGIEASFAGRTRPRRIDMALAVNDKIGLTVDRGHARVTGPIAGLKFPFEPLRRGIGELSTIWLRWQGPMGLIWRQKVEHPEREIIITPNTQAVKEEAIRLFSRQASFGMKVQRDLGEGAEFHALRDFLPGMDRRSVDWKQSARHARLLAKEHHTERNHPIILAIDCGRAMSEPTGGLPRLDRAINAALLLAFVSLKLGDKIGLFAFDSHVRVASGVVSGVRGYSLIQRLAAEVDYSTEDTNFTLGLTTLGGRLERRSLVVIFTDFPDTISAELMIENLGPLLKRHRVLFVAMRDVELEALVRAEPVAPEDVSRAVTAGALLREREVVLRRLRHLGVDVLEAPLEQLGPELVSAYLAIKQRNVL